MEFRSNLFYNWGRGFAGYNEDEATLIRYAFIDNAYLAGPDSEGALAFRERNRLARAWFAGNSMNGVDPGRSLVAGRRRDSRRLSARRRRSTSRRSRPIPRPSAMTQCWRAPAPGRATPPTRASSKACAPAPGRHIDSQEEVGGWPTLAAGRARAGPRRRRHARRLGARARLRSRPRRRQWRPRRRRHDQSRGLARRAGGGGDEDRPAHRCLLAPLALAPWRRRPPPGPPPPPGRPSIDLWPDGAPGMPAAAAGRGGARAQHRPGL